MKKILSTLFIVLAFSSSVSALLNMSPVSAQPQPTTAQQAGSGCGGGSLLSFPRWYDGICEGNGQIKSPDAVGGIGNFIWTIALNVIEMMLHVTGYVSLAFIIWGGFKYMISGDNASGTAAARKTILNAIIGLVLSIMAVGIVNVVVSSIGGTLG